MVKGKDLKFGRRFLLPTLGLLCCVFMVYCCWVGKGYQQVLGYLIFFAIVLFIGYLFKNPKKAAK